MASPSSSGVALVGSPVVAAAAPPSAPRGVRDPAGEDPGQRAGRRARANHRGRHRRPDPGLLGRVRRAASDHLLRGSVFGVAATAVTSLLGFGYWFLAARLVPAATVGYASAVMSLVAGVGLLTGLGVNSLVLERLPPLEGTPQWVEVVSSWLWPTTLLAAAVSAVVVLAGHASRAPVSGLELLVVMSTASAGVVVLGILDRVFLSARRADIGLLLAAATGVGKLASLLVLVVPGAALATLLGGWAVGVVAAAAAGCVLLVPRLRQGSLRLPQRWTKTREELKRVFGHHLTSVGGLLTPYLLPTIVVYRLDATHNAYFYASWMLGSVFLIISPAVASSLFVEGARDVGALARRTARALRILACLLPAPIVGAVVLGPAGPVPVRRRLRRARLRPADGPRRLVGAGRRHQHRGGDPAGARPAPAVGGPQPGDGRARPGRCVGAAALTRGGRSGCSLVRRPGARRRRRPPPAAHHPHRSRMTVADGRPLVLFAENEAYESFLMFAAALRRRGLRVQRLTTRPSDRRARARMLLQRLVFQRIDAVLDRSIRGGGVDPLPLPTSYGGCAALEATEATAQALLRSGRRLGVPKTAHDEHLLYDKLALTRFAEAHGVAVPRTWSRLEDAPDGPLVVKGALGSGGSAVRVAQDRASAQAAWRELAAGSDTVFVQEFAGGPVHSVGGVAREGRMVAASAYRSRPADGKPLGPPGRRPARGGPGRDGGDGATARGARVHRHVLPRLRGRRGRAARCSSTSTRGCSARGQPCSVRASTWSPPTCTRTTSTRPLPPPTGRATGGGRPHPSTATSARSARPRPSTSPSCAASTASSAGDG